MLFGALLAVIAAAPLTQNALSQVAPEEQTPAGANPPGYKYEAYAGFGYTSLNQVNQSRYGLIGVDLSLTRDFGRYFGLTGMANYYKPPLQLGSSTTSTTTVGGSTVTVSNGNPGDPSIYEVLAGPEIHANIYGPVSGFLHGGLGAEHTGGEGETPSLSFAGGFGGGMTYDLSSRFAIRASGDRIGASFSLRNNQTGNPQQPVQGFSPHRTWNSSGTIGLLFRF